MADLRRIAIIGAGFIGVKHVEAYGFVERASVAAVVDANLEKAEALAGKIRAKAYTSMKEMLSKEELDVVDVCLPTTMHKDAVIEGLETGHDVIVEKPFALNMEDVDAMIEASLKHGKRLMVAHVNRFKPEYVLAKSIIDSGELGKPVFFGAWRESLTPNWSWNNWLQDKKKSGGTILDLSIHDIDISNWFFGAPEHFYAQESMIPGREGPSHVVSNLTYPGGVSSVIEAGHLMPPIYPFTVGYRLVLEKGALEFALRENEGKTLKIFTENKITAISEGELKPMLGSNPYAEELNHFIDCLITGEEFRISVEEAKLAVETVRRLMDSMDRGQRL